MATIKVTDVKGVQQELTVFSPADLKTFIADKSGPGKKAVMKYLNALGRPINEVVHMGDEEREEFILKRYTELGVGADGAVKAKARGTVRNLKAAPAPTTVSKPEPEDEDEEDEEEEAVEDEEEEPPPEVAKAPKAAAPATASKVQAPPATGSDVNTAILKELRALSAAVAGLVETHDLTAIDLGARLTTLEDQLHQQEKTLLDTHFVTRVIARAGHELTTDDITSFSEELYDTLVVEPSEDAEEDELEAGNG